jgi:hypothetical protein
MGVVFYQVPYSKKVDKTTGGSRLVQISLVRISLLRFLKTFHKYEFWAIYFISAIFWAKYLANVIFWQFISLLRFALC